MNKIIRWYNQNRKMFWSAIAIVIVIIILLQILNNYYKENAEQEQAGNIANIDVNNNYNYSVVNQKEIDDDTSNDAEMVIKSFFEYCNNLNIEEAYNLLSDECKQELYPTLDEFKQSYVDRVFTEKRLYNIALWITNNYKNTYRLEIYGDILATGKKDQMPIEDYYTVIYENGEIKLNISRYIGRENINLSKEQDGIEINIISKQIYLEYEKYLVTVKNNTELDVVLNTKQDINSLYLQDENGLKYTAFLNEISNFDLNIKRNLSKDFNIKFNREYKPTIKVKKMIFDNIKVGQEIDNKKIEIDM